MNIRYPLAAEARTVLGHKVNKLRKTGVVPATLYGRGMTPTTITIPLESFLSVYKKAGETHIVDLSVSGKTYPVLIHTVQQHPVSNIIQNVEFLTVNLTEKLKTYVPIQIVGESQAVKDGKGTVITTLQEIEVECLPTNIPESVDVDISSLTEVDQEIKVSQLSAATNVVILADPEQTVVKIGAIVVEAAPAVAEPAEGEEKPSASEEPAASPEPSEKTE
jgi:large subunit ribosomal protein L25